jgi:hypothetical protein
MLIFGNMAGEEDKKLAIVLECMEIDNPRSPKDYIANLLSWDMADLAVYRERRKHQQMSLVTTGFQPHP